MKGGGARPVPGAPLRSANVFKKLYIFRESQLYLSIYRSSNTLDIGYEKYKSSLKSDKVN